MWRIPPWNQIWFFSCVAIKIWGFKLEDFRVQQNHLLTPLMPAMVGLYLWPSFCFSPWIYSNLVWDKIKHNFPSSQSSLDQRKHLKISGRIFQYFRNLKESVAPFSALGVCRESRLYFVGYWVGESESLWLLGEMSWEMVTLCMSFLYFSSWICDSGKEEMYNICLELPAENNLRFGSNPWRTSRDIFCLFQTFLLSMGSYLKSVF